MSSTTSHVIAYCKNFSALGIGERGNSSGDFNEAPPPPPDTASNTSREALHGSELSATITSSLHSELPTNGYCVVHKFAVSQVLHSTVWLKKCWKDAVFSEEFRRDITGKVASFGNLNSEE